MCSTRPAWFAYYTIIKLFKHARSLASQTICAWVSTSLKMSFIQIPKKIKLNSYMLYTWDTLVFALQCYYNEMPVLILNLYAFNNYALFERHQFNYYYGWIFVIGTLFGNWYLVVCSSIEGITFELDEEMAANDDDREALQDIINNTKMTEKH